MKFRENCDFPYLFVFDHKVFPCSLAMTINDLGVADYKTDYIDIRDYNDDDSLHDAILKLDRQKLFQTCRHCDGGGGGASVNSAAQGFLEKFAVPSKN